MKNFVCLITCFLTFNAMADQGALDVALRATYNSCVGINNELVDLKTRAGINTVVTGVGTGLGAGAVAVGVMRSNELFTRLRDIPVDTGQQMQQIVVNVQSGWTPNLKAGDVSKSKKLGNWRTGLLAANTATNVAGAVIASKNRPDTDLQTSVDECSRAVRNLNDAIIAARTENIDVTEAQQIYAACYDFTVIDLSKIESRATGAVVSSVVGAGTGAVGTVVSATANRDENLGNKKLDNASNVLAGGATIASGAATVFNATQIAAIRKVADVAQKCEDVLK